jgi:outer membrane lipase/esterase
MLKTRSLARIAIFVTLIALGIPVTAGAAGFDQFVVFGDSTLDTGYFAHTTSGLGSFDIQMQAALAKGLTGGWAGDGTMNTTMLANKFGLSLVPSDAPGGGTNYANGGATTVVNPDSMVPNNVCTLYQIDNYLNSVHGVANPRALYLIKTGDNDVTYYYFTADQAFRDANPNYLRNGALDLAERVARLQAAGARTIAVRNSYDSALFAGPGGEIMSQFTEVMAASRQLGRQEWAFMAQRGIRFVPVDNDTLFGFVAHHPTLFGFDINTVQAINAPYANPHVDAAFDVLTPYQMEHYLFIDGVHLTTAGQAIEADLTYSMLVAPSQMSLLAESAVQNGWAHSATIQGQLDPGSRHSEACGRNVWSSVGTYALEVRNAPGFPSDSGTPFGGSVGIDYQTEDGFVVGAAFTSGSQMPGFSTGGHFSLVDMAPSLYAAYVGDPFWGNAVLSYDLSQYDVSRAVQLGSMFTDQNHATTDGQSLVFALRGGGNMTFGRFATGPVAGVVLQDVHVGAFTETSNTGLTALSFGVQTRSSFVTQLGWRISMDKDRFRPFAEAAWNHECSGYGRTVTATLTSAEAPSYSMDAVPVVADWATSSLGACYELNPQVMLRGAASAMFINPQMITCGGEFGLNFSF